MDKKKGQTDKRRKVVTPSKPLVQGDRKEPRSSNTGPGDMVEIRPYY